MRACKNRSVEPSSFPLCPGPRPGPPLVKQIKVYPLSEAAAHPPHQRFIDMTGVLYEPAVPYNADFYVSLARMVNEEPAQTKDMEILGMLLPLGIEKGKTDSRTSALSRPEAWLRGAKFEALGVLILEKRRG
jgi:hypothetical protein